MTSITKLRTYICNDKIITFFTPEMRYQSNLNDIESNIHALVLLNLLNSLRKRDKCSQSLAFYLFSSARLIHSISHEYSSKILYVYSQIQSDMYGSA